MTIPPSGDPKIDELLDSLRAAGVPDDELLPTLLARLAVARSDNPDWVTHCNYCSALYNGAMEHCPRDKRHRVRRIDANSPAFRAFVAERRAAEASLTSDPNITLKLFHARVADYHHLLEGRDHTTKVTVNQLEDAAAEAMLHAVDLFKWLAKGGYPPDWTQQR